MKTLISAIVTFIIGNVLVGIIYSAYCHEWNPKHWPLIVQHANSVDYLIISEVLLFIVVLIASIFETERERKEDETTRS
jgi:hypothetical protein